jgi:hypothetical protein
MVMQKEDATKSGNWGWVCWVMPVISATLEIRRIIEANPCKKLVRPHLNQKTEVSCDSQLLEGVGRRISVRGWSPGKNARLSEK